MPRSFKPTVSSVSFVLLHASVLAAPFMPFRWELLLVGGLSYALRMFAITAGYHRYFSHRAFRTNRVVQFLLAFLAQASAQKGVLWWAANHRVHHRHSDTARDLHSPIARSFWWSHVGWVLSDAHDGYDPDLIPDFQKYPELRFLNAYHWLCPWIYGAGLFALGLITGWGPWSTLLWGFGLSTVALLHATFSINSLAHLWGRRRFATADRSRNNLWLALITFGEGWHNNHHAHPGAARQGLRWWELDFTWYALVLLSWLRLVRDLKPWPRQVGAEARS